LAQRDEDPGPLRDLVLAVLTGAWPEPTSEPAGGNGAASRTKPSWLSVAIPRHGPASHVLDDVPCFTLPVSLMAVTRAGTRWNNVDFRTQRCGVEHLFL